MKFRTLLLIALVLFVGLTSVTTAGMKQQRKSSARLMAIQPTDAEVISLWYMRQEEKLARDVYITLYEEWEAPVFANISESEQRHMDAIKRLIDLYNLEDPVAGLPVGEFTDPVFNDLYDELTDLGAQSIIDAFGVGVSIEEMDIADLNEELEQVTTRNVKRVFENLLAGSENHLAAFLYNLENYDPDLSMTCVNGGTCQQAGNCDGTCVNDGSQQQFRDCDGTCINDGSRQQARDRDGTCINQ